jgi:hypothetical protein
MNLRILGAAAILGVSSFATFAQDNPTEGALAFQLNKAETREGSCQLTYVVQNSTGSVIEKSVFNIAIIDAEGAVSQLVNIEFRTLPIGRPKIQAFGIPSVPCEAISAISINDFVQCTTETEPESDICERAITQSSRIAIEFPWVP